MRICTPRQSPRRDPKFHKPEIFEGDGNSTKAPDTILRAGCEDIIFVILIKG